MQKMFIELAVLTLQKPQEAAGRILSLRLGRDALWSGLILVAVLNTLVFSLTIMLTGSTPLMPAFFSSPLSFFVVFAGLLVLTVHAFYWTGRAMGGKGDLGDLLAVTVWLQALRVAAQVGGLILLLVLPVAMPIYSLFVAVAGFWILLSFLSVALRLNSLFRAFAVVLVAALALACGVFILGSVIGLAAVGVVPNV